MAYFEKYVGIRNLEEYNIKTLEEFEQACISLYEKGFSLREIGEKFNIDHHSISALFKRLRVKVEKRYSKGSKNGSSKLNEEQVRDVKALIKNGIPLKKIAQKYGVSQSTISDIKAGRTWNHLQ